MSSTQLISVVVTTYNRSEALSPVLKALGQQGDKAFEVIVADDGSVDLHRTANLQEIRACSLRGAYVWHPDLGFTASRVRNLGVAAARGDYIIFLDGDCVPETDFVAQHRRLQELGCYLNGSRVMLSQTLTSQVIDHREQVWGRSALYWADKRLRGQASKLAGLLRLPNLPVRKQASFRWHGIRSCNMGVWRADFERVDGFDESFHGWGHEDADFALRLHNAGVTRKNGFCATEVFHLWHPAASRDRESTNASRVLERQSSCQVLPTVGFRASRQRTDWVVTELGY